MHPLCAPQRKTAMVILQPARSPDLGDLALLAPARAYLLEQRARASEQPCEQDADNKAYDEREWLKLHVDL